MMRFSVSLRKKKSSHMSFFNKWYIEQSIFCETEDLDSIYGDEKGNKVNTKKWAILFSFLFFREGGGGVGGGEVYLIVSKNNKNNHHPKFHPCRLDYTYWRIDYSTFTSRTKFCKIHFSTSPMFNYVSFLCLTVTGLIRDQQLSHSCTT